MNLQEIEAIIAKNLTITDQCLMDGVIGAVLDAAQAEREACARLLDDNWFKTQSECAAAIRARGEV